MADRHTKEQRSRNMARIRKFGNESTELRMVRLFRQNGVKGWRRHLPLPGRPDFAFRRERIALFLDGCFWHRCPCCNWTPASNADYWLPKLERNIRKDREADRQLVEKGWTVVRVWEHEIKQAPEAVLSRVVRALHGGSS